MLYATDASLYQVEPIGVVVPADLDDAVEAVRACAALGLGVLPRGGGTSLAGQCTSRSVVLDLSAACLSIGPIDGNSCTAEAGVTVDDLNDAIRTSGLFFAPDPATARHATIGGCIGNNAAGTRSIKYGRTSENIAWIDACLADGARARFDAGAATRDARVRSITSRVVDVVVRHESLIRERFPKTVRRNAGYALDMMLQQIDVARAQGIDPVDAINLSPLLCGSEGTLAVTLRAGLELRPIPAARGLAIVGFATLEEAIDAVVPIVGTEPSAVELLDDMVISLARNNLQASRDLAVMPVPAEGELAAVLYVEYSTESADALDDRFRELRDILPGAAMETHTRPQDMARALRLRKAGEPLLHGVPGERKPITFVEDNAVPVERLSEFVRRFKEIVARHGTIAAYYAHASVGVLHVRPLLDVKDDDDRARMEAIATEVADLAGELGGVMSGEHGDGRVRGPLLERHFGPELMGAFREIKAIFDPEHRLNPGNIVEPGPIGTIHERMRVSPDERALPRPPVDSYFSYDDQHGFWGAVEMCNGAGVCRKKQGGTMCPSYMGTLDERHSTRGRGNALRLATTGQFESLGGSGPDWQDAQTIDTLDLCLSCKACKAECPSNVDIARLKAEYTAQRFRERGGPDLRSWVFANVRTLNRLGAIAPAISNAIGALAPVRRLIGAALGLHPRRSLPRFERLGKPAFEEPDDRPVVVLFGDCFSMFNETGIVDDARRVLNAFGYRVVLADAGCCGRSAISLGVLERAVDQIDETVAKLGAALAAHHGAHVVFAEPSCHSAVVDDWLSLKTGSSEDRKRSIAERSMLLDEFLEARWDEHPSRPSFNAPRGQIVLHTHCHQRATVGAEPGARLLERLFPGRVEVLDAGCCGMAGSFGFSKHRYDLSMKIGERVLLPRARGLVPGDVLVAAGTSCRHQIHDGASTRALHPLEFLARQLG